MKPLLILLVVLAVVWLWRNARTAAAHQRPPQPPAAAPPLTVVACGQCGVHIPAGDAVMGTRAAYCCTAHRQQAES